MSSTTIGPAVRYQLPDDRPQSPKDGRSRPQPAGDKLAVPQPNVNVLRRPRVTELIQRAAAHRVTLVCGPAGSGKTVACASWAAASPAAGRVAWLSLDPGDREPARLWGHLRSALAGTPAVPGELTAELAGDLAGAGADDFSLRLVEAAERLTAPVTLVLDDIQELAGSNLLPDVDFLVRHGPPALRLLLCGRHPAGFGVARLRVGGELAEIGEAELACTPQEADSYFAMLGIDVPAAERDELLARTQGWMTGLRLAALRAGQDGRDAPARRISAITGDDPAVADYLWDEVLATQAAGDRLFMLRTSVADRICGGLADALTGEAGGAAILDRICRENLMVQAVTDLAGHDASAEPARAIAADAEPGTGIRAAGTGTGRESAEYRYHPLLLDLLRAQLRRELPDEVPLLARRAAGWQAAHGFPVEAIRNAAQADDWDFAARVLAEAGPAVCMPGPAAEIEPVLALFPASRCGSDAAVAATMAAIQLRAGQPGAAAQHLDQASRALGRSSSDQRRVIAPWLQALRLTSASRQPPVDAALIEQSTALARQAADSASSAADHQALGLLWCALGVAHLAGRDVADARGALAEATRRLAGGRREFGVRARAWRAVAEALHGDLVAASGLIADLRDGASWASDPVSTQLIALAAAQVSWARDDAATASLLLGQCDADAEPARPGRSGIPAGTAQDRPAGGQDIRNGDPGIEPVAGQIIGWLAGAARARLSLGDGDLAAARDRAARLQYQGLDPGAGPAIGSAASVDPALAVLDADIALRDGDPGRARLALARASEGRGFDRADLAVAHARVLLAESDNRGALAAAGRCLDGTASQITLHDQISALITASVACRRLGQAERAVEQLTGALVLAEPHGSYRAFLDGGPAVRSALTVLIRPASQGAALTARILQRFDTCPARPGDPPGGAAVPLTSSELAVLRFLPSHMTNQEIAEALFLSINTVKTHLRSVYRKLSVTTRRQAISRASRLGLL